MNCRCGSGGMGPALDNIDQCWYIICIINYHDAIIDLYLDRSMTHDKCYGDVEKLPCKGIFQTPYSV